MSRSKILIFLKYVVVAFLISIVFETLALLFTDNRMYENAYDSMAPVVAMQVVNWFRFLVWFVISLIILYQWKNIRDYAVNIRKNINIRYIYIAFFMEAAFFSVGLIGLKFLRGMISRHHLIFLLFFGLFIITLFYYYRKIIQRIETLFLIVSLLFSLCYILTAAVFVTGGDQGVHFVRTMGLAQAYNEVDYESEYDFYNEEGTSISLEQMDAAIERVNEEPIYSYVKSKRPVFPTVRYISYIPAAAVLAIADAINLSPTAAYFSGQICNALIYILIIYFSACKLKAGKLILILFASLPRVLFLATRYSYTPWVIAWITFACAYIIGELQDAGKIVSKKDMLMISGSFFLGIVVKGPYFMIVPLALLISKYKFKNLDAYKKYLVLMFITMLLLFMTLIIPIFTNGVGVNIYSDIRGGENVNAFEQMKFILMHPIKYIEILLKNIYTLISPSSFVFGESGFTAMRGGILTVMPSVIALLFMWVIITDKKISIDYCLVMKKRIFVFALTFVNICWICTVMYMNYNDVGTAMIKGCNPLYLMTFMFPFFYYCSSRHVQSNFKWRRYNTAVYGLFSCIMFITIYIRVVMLYTV